LLHDILEHLRMTEEPIGPLAQRLDAVRRGITDRASHVLATEVLEQCRLNDLGFGRSVPEQRFEPRSLVERLFDGELGPGHLARIHDLDVRYDIDWHRPLGAGGLGEVYRATRRIDDRPVVIKRTLDSMRQREDIQARNLIEIVAMQRARRHRVPGILELLEYGKIGESIYLVLPFVRGGTLEAVLRCHPRGLPLPAVLHWGAQLFRTLAALHDAGLLHRDVKPGNILLTAPLSVGQFASGAASSRRFKRIPDPVLCDFGSAKVQGLSSISFIPPHTPPYAAPEQVRPFGTMGTHTDVYGAAVVLCEMLVGGERRAAVVRQLMGGGGATVNDAPASLRELLTACLCWDSGRRLGDAGSVAEALADPQRAVWR